MGDEGGGEQTNKHAHTLYSKVLTTTNESIYAMLCICQALSLRVNCMKLSLRFYPSVIVRKKLVLKQPLKLTQQFWQ